MFATEVTVRKIIFLLLFALISFPAAGSDMKVGLARIEITPPVGYVMGGYSARKGGSTGVQDPLYATALVIRSGAESLAIVSLDLRSFPSERVRDQVRSRLGIKHVMLCSTHTHSGPLTWEDKSWPDSANPWFSATEDAVVALIGEARRREFCARLRSGRGRVYLGHNRRLVGPDVRVTMFWRNEKREPTSPLDPTVRVIEIADEEANIRALLVHYACHAVILGPDNREISADWPGFMRRELEQRIGNGVMTLFLQGAGGDINPFLDKQPVEKGGFERAEKAGREIAEEVLRVLKEMEKRPLQAHALQVTEDLIEIPHRWDAGRVIPVGLITAILGSEVAFSGWPGEPFVEFQIGLEDRSLIPNTLLVGYCFSTGGVWAGYFPTIRAAVEGGYGAGYNSTVAVGTGERLVRLSLRRIYEALGRLKPLPASLR